MIFLERQTNHVYLKSIKSFALATIFLLSATAFAQQQFRRYKQFRKPEGLSQNQVVCILQDSLGYLWLGTQDGLNRFDGYEFEHFSHNPDDPNSLSGDFILSLHEDRHGKIWIGTNSFGLSVYDPVTDSFNNYTTQNNDAKSIPNMEIDAIEAGYFRDSPVMWIGSNGYVSAFSEDWGVITNFDKAKGIEGPIKALLTTPQFGHKGALWIGTKQGLLYLDIESETIHRIDGVLNSEAISSLEFDPHTSQIWIGTLNGLFSLDISKENSRVKPLFEDLEIYDLFETEAGQLWIATDQGGYRYDPMTTKRDAYQFFGKPHPIQSIHEDHSGVAWFGTQSSGVIRYDTGSERFGHYTVMENDPNSLRGNAVFFITEDSQQNIWLATSANGVEIFNRKEGRFQHYGGNQETPEDPMDTFVFGIAEDKANRMWLGTSNRGLVLFEPGKGILKHFLKDESDPRQLPSNAIKTLRKDSKNNLWVGSSRGISLYQEETNDFVTYRANPKDPSALSHRNVQWIFEFADRFWLATLGGGVNKFNPITGKVEKRIQHEPGNPNSLSTDLALTIYGDAEADPDHLWIGTGLGLNKLNIHTGNLIVYGEKQGLPNKYVYSIESDDDHNLWMSTNNGIAQFNPVTETFTTFTLDHGLQALEYAQTSSIRTHDGQILFGGVDGINIFDPNNFSGKDQVSTLALRELRIFNDAVTIKRVDPKSPIENPIAYTESFTLDYKQNVFALEFAALNPRVPDAVEYAYQLEGFNENWIHTTSKNRLAVFTNLGAGTYQFRLKASTTSHNWRELEQKLNIHIKPHPLQTKWAYALYIFLIFGMVYYYVSNQRKKLAFERAVNERQNAINERLRQVDKFKDEILANTSHELRTPLHGIIGLADSLRDGSAGKLPPRAVRNLDMIISSGKRLTTLVNDILDFSKLKTKKLELSKTPVDLHTLTEMVLTLSKPLLATKTLELINAIPEKMPPINADENRLQQILHNLVGNAIKFTETGFVKVSAGLDRAEDRLTVQVIDTGIGIPEEKVETIFNAFEQADSSAIRNYGGTGLGLAITKHLVALHGGNITVNSVMDKGSIFSFSLPLSDLDGDVSDVNFETTAKVHAYNLEEQEKSENFALPQDGGAREKELVGEGLLPEEVAADSRLLIVDDEPINRQVLLNYLSPLGYQAVEAANGFEALRIIREEAPFDLVLLDIMMPRMSGYEVCTELRKTFSVNELPIIFLTAKNQAQDLVEGFATGANDYLTKPITKSELLARVRTHLKLLNFHRNLEAKVAERTRELRDKNLELDAKYKELETLNSIVKTINSEVELSKVIELLLEQGLVLFDKAERSSFMLYDPSTKAYRFVGARGHSLDELKDLSLTYTQLYELYMKEVREVQEGVYVGHRLDTLRLQGHHQNLPSPASLVALTIPQDGKLAGLLFLDHPTRQHAFHETDIAKMGRFREHAVSAIAKARVIDDLVGTQNELVEAANLAGKAEIATNVLHNVGNTLNSVRTSVHMIQENMCERKWLNLFQRIVDLLHDNEKDLAAFFTQDSRSQMLPGALERIFKRINQQVTDLGTESRRLVEHVQNIVGVLMEQERHASFKGGLIKAISINDVIEETLRMEAYLLKHKRITIETSYGNLPPVSAEKSKVIRILFNILKNSWQGIEEAFHENGLIRIQTSADNQNVFITVEDDGIGIRAENLGRVYEQGFTTKKHCEGFGLHYAANAMKDMCGSIMVESQGRGKGCKVQLSFPIAIPEQDDLPEDKQIPDHQLEA